MSLIVIRHWHKCHHYNYIIFTFCQLSAMQGDLTTLKGGENPAETVESLRMAVTVSSLPLSPGARLLVLASAFLLLLSACQPQPVPFAPGVQAAAQPVWQYADLRQVDPADALLPEADVLAVYLRATPGSRHAARLEIRLDLLSYQIEQPTGWLVALDHAPGGQSLLPNGSPSGRPWDSLLVISAGGSITLLDSALSPRPAAAVQVLRHSTKHQIEISLNLSALPAARAGIWAQVFSTNSDTVASIVLDESAPAALHARPPHRVPLMLVFWDSFPAYTPAQALRRWDGAHTGPLGGRHGLYNLLRAARNHAIPISLLDLSAPTSLSALDYAAGLQLVQQMNRARLLILPAWQPGSALPSPENACQPYPSGQAAADFGLQILPAASNLLIESLAQALPPPEAQLDEHGLSLQARSLLAGSASQDNPLPVVLGGSLPSSHWGVPEMARAAIAEIRSRPWIEPASAHDFQAWLGAQQPLRFPESGPPGSLALAVQQACSSLYAPLFPADPALPELRSRYHSQLAVLQLAAAWEASPFSAATCTQDLDEDELPECLLASPTVLAVFQPQSATLSYLFVRDGAGAHQLVAPSSQFVIGQSESRRWQLAESQDSLLADPDVIPGALQMNQPCSFQVTSSEIVFECTASSARYRLTGAGISASLNPAGPPALPALRFPLAFDSWQRFTPGWGSRFSVQQQGDRLRLDYQHGSALLFWSSQPYQVHAFDATRQLMGFREDPNTEFPTGHYLPFPMLLLEFAPASSLDVRIELESAPPGL